MIRSLLTRSDGRPPSPAGQPLGLLEHVPDALFSLDHAWRFTYLNPGAELLFQRSREALLSGCLWSLFPETVGSVFDEQYHRAVAEGIPVVFEACHPPLGTWVEVRAFPSTDGLDVHARDIAPGKRAAEALRQWVLIDDVRFRALIEHAADIIVLLNLDGTVRYVSPAVKRVLGYAPEEWIGRSVFEAIHPDDRLRMQRGFAEHTRTRGVTERTECRVQHVDGSWRWIEAIGNNLLEESTVGGVVIAARDITDRKGMEAELHATKARFEAVFDGAAIGIGVTDMAGRIVMSNRALQALLGYGEEELQGKSFDEVAHPDDRSADARPYAELVAGQRDQYQANKRFVRQDGQVVWGSLTVSLVRSSDGSPQFAIGMVEDVTERERAAAELAEAQRRLAASREAERLRLARDLHDGPVQDLLVVSYQLADQRRALGHEAAGTALGAGLEAARWDVLGVVTELRDVIGELRPPGLAEFGLQAALEGYVTQLRREEGESLPAIALEIDPQVADLPEPLALTLFRVAQEALRNALRHSGARQVTVGLQRSIDDLVLEVRDDGCGFRMPARLNDLTNAGHFGLVGLAERVDQAGGELTVLSEPGAGTAIAVRLPLTEGRNDHDGADPRRAGR